MFHLHIRYLSRDGGGSCESARQYAVREGRFRTRGDIVRLVRSLHMPEWATEASAENYWKAAEGPGSRVNARTALLIVFALPRNLSRERQNRLALRMAEEVSALCGSTNPDLRLPVTIVVHEGYGRNPHVHLLVSTSANDGIARPAARWFRRFSPRVPGHGGAPRPRFVSKRAWLHEVRQTWETVANKALRDAMLEPVLDHRSHAARGLNVLPTLHLGPRLSHLSRASVETPRAARNRLISEENEKRLRLEAEIAECRAELWRLELASQVLTTARGVWNLYRQIAWRDLLASHPLAGGAQEIRSVASVMLLERDQANVPHLRAAYEAIPDARGFLDLIGPEWDAVTTSAGIWGVRPGCDSVVMLGPGYVVTDGEDAAAARALAGVAALLPFVDPVVIVRRPLAPRGLEELHAAHGAVTLRLLQPDVATHNSGRR